MRFQKNRNLKMGVFKNLTWSNLSLSFLGTNPIAKGLVAIIYAVFLVVCTSCYNGSQTLIPREIFTPKEVEEGFVLKFQPKVDILFFIDHSGSMSSAQTSLVQNIDAFIEAMEKNKFLDYHIGVLKIPTFNEEENDESTGRMIGDPHFVTRDTPEGLLKIKENIVMGGLSGNGDELFFSPLFFAFNENLNINEGFVRPEAFLVIIIISDTHDQGKIHSGFKVYNEIISRKANDSSMLLGYGAIAYPEFFEDDCYRENDNWSDNLFDFLEKFENSRDSKIGGGINSIPKSELVYPRHYDMTNVFSLCDVNFGEKMANIGEDIRNRVSNKIPLPVRPIDGSINIKYGNELLDKDLWRHDFRSNSIILSSEALVNQKQSGLQFFVIMDEADPLNTIGKPTSPQNTDSLIEE